MRGPRSIACTSVTLLLATTLVAAGQDSRASREEPVLETVLEHAAVYVARYLDVMSGLTAEERYVQDLVGLNTVTHRGLPGATDYDPSPGSPQTAGPGGDWCGTPGASRGYRAREGRPAARVADVPRCLRGGRPAAVRPGGCAAGRARSGSGRRAPARTACPGRGRRRGRGAVAICHDAEDEARDEKAGGKDRRRPRQRVRLAAAGHEARDAAAAAEPEPALRALQQHDRDEREHDEEMNDDEDRLHALNLRRALKARECAPSIQERGAMSNPGRVIGRVRRGARSPSAKPRR